MSNRARSVEIRTGKNVLKLVDENGKELGRVHALYNFSAKVLTIIPKSVRSLKVMEVG